MANPTFTGSLPQGNFGYGELTNLDSQLGVSAGNQPTFNGPNGLVYQVHDAGNNTFSISTNGQTTAGNQALDMANQLQQMQLAANQPAIQTLQTQYNPATGSGALTDKYNQLLSSINQQGSVATNSATLGASNELAARGIIGGGLRDMTIGSAIAPVAAQFAGITAQTGLGEQQDLQGIIQQIASLQAGNVQGAIQGATNFGGLANQAALIPSQIAQLQGQTQQEQAQAAALNAQAKYMPTSYGASIFNTQSGSYTNPLLSFLMG